MRFPHAVPKKWTYIFYAGHSGTFEVATIKFLNRSFQVIGRFKLDKPSYELADAERPLGKKSRAYPLPNSRPASE